MPDREGGRFGSWVRAALAVAIVSAVVAAGPTGPTNADELTNGISVSWTPENPANHPTSRVDQAMAYHPDTSTTVLFGGRTTSGVMSDTWTWDGTTWTHRPSVSAPPARIAAGLAYDDVSRTLILFGGYDGNGIARGDTWAWNGSSWTELTPAHSPEARGGVLLAQDPTGGVLLGTPGDMWHWTGTDWEPRNPPCCGPANIVDLEYNPAIDETVALAISNFEFQAQTWVWDGSSWEFVLSPQPEISAGAALAFSPQLGQLVLYTGSPQPPSGQYANTTFTGTYGFAYAETVDLPVFRFPHRGGISEGPGGEVVMFGGTAEPQGGGLFGDTWTIGGTFRATESLGGAVVGAPAAAAWAPGRLDAFVRGTDNGLWHKWFSGGWSGWENLGGGLTEEPAVATWASGRLDVFVRGTDNALWHRWYDQGWSAWERLGGTLDSAPAAVAWGPNRLDVFVRGTDRALWHKWWDGVAWRGWEPLGGQLTSRAAVSSWSGNRLDVFVKGTDNAMWHKWWDGVAWRDYEPLGGTFSFPPAAVSRRPGSIDVFNGLWQGGFRGTWVSPPYVRVLSDATSTPAVTAWGPDRFDLFVRSNAGDLRHLVSR